MENIGLTILCLCLQLSLLASPSEKDTLVLPTAIQQEVQQLKSTDDLSGWIYAHINYAVADPAHRLEVLSHAETAAWRKPHSDEDFGAWLDLLVNQGYYQLYTGNILSSIQYYEKAWHFYKTIQPDQYDVEEFILQPLGNNYTRLGDYESALYIQEQCLSLAKHKKDARLIVAAYANMAVLRRSQGHWQNAIALCELGLPYAANNTPVRGLLLNTLGDVAFDQGQYNRAREYNRMALQIFRKATPASNTSYWMESACVLAGKLEMADRNYPVALQYYREALAITTQHFKGGRQREKAKIQVYTGNALLAQNNITAAQQAYRQALALLLPAFTVSDTKSLPEESSLYAENTLQDALEGLSATYHQQNNTALALKSMDLCLAATTKLRNEFAGMDSRRLLQQENRRRIELAMRIAYHAWQTTGNKVYTQRMLQYAEQGKAQLLLDEIRRNIAYAALRDKDTLFRRMQHVEQALAYYGQQAAQEKNTAGNDNASALAYEMSALQRKLQDKYPALMQSSRVTSLQCDTLLQNLPDNTEAIICFAGQSQWFFLHADRHGVHSVHIIDSVEQWQQQCKDFVQRYFKQGPGAMINAPQAYYADAWHLYQQLFPTQQWEANKAYLLLTDDVLGYVPLDALVTDSTYQPNITAWPFLVKKAAISYGYSLQSWQQLRHHKAGTGGFTGFFITHDSSHRRIPAVEQEQQQLKDHVRGNYVSNQAATLTHFEQALQQANILHISTHAGLYGPQQEPMLELTDGNFPLSALTAQLHAPQLVVLSACRTADGWLMQGEGIQSLSWGFAAAGIPGVVAGLWNVNDAGTASFMPHFYAGLQQQQSPGTALHHAKLQWLQEQQTNPVLSLPYYWAGWVYIGVPQTLTITAPHRLQNWWILVIFGVLIAGGLWWWKKHPVKTKS
jgi:CHAT domain-containing protein